MEKILALESVILLRKLFNHLVNNSCLNKVRVGMTVETLRENLFSSVVKFVTFSESPLNIQRLLIYIKTTFPFRQRHNGSYKGKNTSFPSPTVRVYSRHPHNRKQVKGSHVYTGSASGGQHNGKL